MPVVTVVLLSRVKRLSEIAVQSNFVITSKKSSDTTLCSGDTDSLLRRKWEVMWL